MRWLNTLISLLIIVATAFIAPGCGSSGGLELPEDKNYGVETGTPQPLENAHLTVTTEDGENYRLVTDENGKGFIARISEYGEVLDEVIVAITLDADGNFEVSATFSDGTVVTLSGSVDSSGTIINVTIEINYIEVNITVIVNHSDEISETEGASDNPIYTLGTNGQNITIYNLGACGDYTTNTELATGFTEDVICIGEPHHLIFSNIVYDNGNISTFDVVIDGVAYSYPDNIAPDLALLLGGGSDLAVAEDTVFPRGTFSSLTIEAWVYPTEEETMVVASDDAYELKLLYTEGEANDGMGVQFVLWDESCILGNTRGWQEYRDIQLNQWNHVAGVLNKDTGKFWFVINGILSTEVTLPAGFNFCSDPSYHFSVGNYFFHGELNAPFTGKIDELRISNTARYTANFTPTETHSSDSHTEGLWHFNETAGSLTFSDVTGNGHTLSALGNARTGE